MNLRALVAVLGLVAGCGIPPDVHDPVKIAQVQPLPFSSQHGRYVETVDTGGTYAQQLFDHVPSDAPEIAGTVQHWRIGETDYYVTLVPEIVSPGS